MCVSPFDAMAGLDEIMMKCCASESENTSSQKVIIDNQNLLQSYFLRRSIKERDNAHLFHGR